MPLKADTNAATAGTSPPVQLAGKKLNIAVQGCCHGELNKIYDACRQHEVEHGIKIDLLLCCGDFQALRSPEDYSSIAMPEKYLQLGDFYLYHGGTRTAPIPTIFIGGNHEASNLLWEEYYGGFIAENIYYLGHSGVVDFGGLRIGGLSGIFKSYDYTRSYPSPPYDKSTVGQAYHIREFEVVKMGLLDEPTLDSSVPPLDVFMTHDWPSSISDYGDESKLFEQKPFLEEDIRHRRLGNPHTMALMRRLRPKYWFGAHYHCRFEAEVPHFQSSNQKTKFLALDKCVARRSFLEVLPMDVHPSRAEHPNVIRRDKEWLGVVLGSHEGLRVTSPGQKTVFVDAGGMALRKAIPEDVPEAAVEARTTAKLLKALGLSSHMTHTTAKGAMPAGDTGKGNPMAFLMKSASVGKGKAKSAPEVVDNAGGNNEEDDDDGLGWSEVV